MLAPLFILLVMLILIEFRFAHAGAKRNLTKKYINSLLFIFAVGEGILFNMIVMEGVKNFVGRPRPWFFAGCNYQNYSYALKAAEAGDQTLLLEYANRTNPSSRVPEDFACDIEPASKIYPFMAGKDPADARKSFPSSHSANLFFGMAFASIFGVALANRVTTRFNALKALVVLGLIIVASIIAGTRVRDQWHHYEDVVGGAFVGTCAAVLAFVINYSSGHEAKESSTKSKKMKGKDEGASAPV